MNSDHSNQTNTHSNLVELLGGGEALTRAFQLSREMMDAPAARYLMTQVENPLLESLTEFLGRYLLPRVIFVAAPDQPYTYVEQDGPWVTTKVEERLIGLRVDIGYVATFSGLMLDRSTIGCSLRILNYYGPGERRIIRVALADLTDSALELAANEARDRILNALHPATLHAAAS